MAYVAPKTNWVAADGVLNTDLNRIEGNIAHLEQGLQNWGADNSSTANVYKVTMSPVTTALFAGLTVRYKCTVASTGACTLQVDAQVAKPILKPNGAAPVLKLNGVYTFVYDGTTNFILQGDGGNGNATAAQLIAGATASTDAGDITGTMVNRSGVYQPANAVDGTYTAQRLYMQPPSGFYDGVGSLSYIYRDDPNWIPANIAMGVTVFGMTGTNGRAYTDTTLNLGSTLTNKPTNLYYSGFYKVGGTDYVNNFYTLTGLSKGFYFINTDATGTATSNIPGYSSGYSNGGSDFRIISVATGQVITMDAWGAANYTRGDIIYRTIMFELTNSTTLKVTRTFQAPNAATIWTPAVQYITVAANFFSSGLTFQDFISTEACAATSGYNYTICTKLIGSLYKF